MCNKYASGELPLPTQGAAAGASGPGEGSGTAGTAGSTVSVRLTGMGGRSHMTAVPLRASRSQMNKIVDTQVATGSVNSARIYRPLNASQTFLVKVQRPMMVGSPCSDYES